MAIERLNFSGANSGSGNIDTPLGTLSDRLMKYGSMLNSQDAERERLKMQQDQIAYSQGRDALADTRYDADKKLQAEEKARLLGKEYNTGRAALALTDPESLKKEALAGEQKAIESTLANASPELRLQIQQELKGYNPAESGKQWVDTALGQSNVDAGMITNLKRDIAKQAADEKYKADSLALQKRQNEIAAGARADSLKLQREELDFKKQQLTKPELSAKQKEFKGNLALFGNDEEKAGIATFGADDWKKIKGTYQDETKKKEYSVGGFKNDFIVEKAGEGLGTWTDSGAQENAAKTRTTLENMQRAMQLPNSEMERIIPLIVGKGGEINKDALDIIYGNKIALDQNGNIIKMSDAFTKIANNPKDFVTVTNEGKTQLLPVQSDAAKKLITNMGSEAMDYYGIKSSEPEKDAAAKRLETLTKNDESKIEDPNIRKNIFGGELAPGGKYLGDRLYDSTIKDSNIEMRLNSITTPGYYAGLTNEDKLRVLTPSSNRLESSKEFEKNSNLANRILSGEKLSKDESDFVNRLKNTNQIDKFLFNYGSK